KGGFWMVVARGWLLATGYGGEWLFPAADESASAPRGVGNVVAVGALGCCRVCGNSGADSRWLYRYSCCAYFMSLIFFGAVAVFRPLISPLDNGYYLIVVLVSVWLLAADTELLLHPDNEPALLAACTAAIVAIVAFFSYVVLKTLQVIAFARRKWAGADVRGAAGTRYREPNQTALFNVPKGGQKLPEMSPSSSSTAPPAAGPPLVVPHVQNLVERTVGGDPHDRILPGQQLSTVFLNELTTDNAVVALEFARPVVPLRDTRAGGVTQRAAFPRWSSFGSLSLDSLESIDLDVWSVGGGGGGGGGPV
ncbi:hypothetical protein MOQ_009991, partial [Trypanosoma cruzi marinkellei]